MTKKEGDTLKKSDIILIGVILVLAVSSWFAFRMLNQESTLEDGIAVVYYNNSRILEIALEDGSYKIYDESRVIHIDEDAFTYHVEGSNPYGVLIQYQNNQVRVIDEESPKHICQVQGWTNSTLYPLTCLPNNIVITIETGEFVLPPVDDTTS